MRFDFTEIESKVFENSNQLALKIHHLFATSQFTNIVEVCKVRQTIHLFNSANIWVLINSPMFGYLSTLFHSIINRNSLCHDNNDIIT